MKRFSKIIIIIFCILFSMKAYNISYSSNSKNVKKVLIVNSYYPKEFPSKYSKDAPFFYSLGDIIEGEEIVYVKNDTDYLKFFSINNDKYYYLPLHVLTNLPKSKIDIFNLSDENPLPINYIPNSVVEIEPAYLYNINDTIFLDKTTYDALIGLLNNFLKDGYDIKVSKGYKSNQDCINDYLEAINSETEISKLSRIKPTINPHQTGLCCELIIQNKNKNSKSIPIKGLERLISKYNFKILSIDNNRITIIYYGNIINKSNQVPKPKVVKLEDISVSNPFHNVKTNKIISSVVNYKNIFSIKIDYVNDNPITFLWIHSSELIVEKSIKYALQRYGGKAISLLNNNERCLNLFEGNEYSYEIDPNRLFTKKGIIRYFETNYPEGKKGEKTLFINECTRIKKFILSQLKPKKEQTIIALHSNKSKGDFSIEYFKSKENKDYYTVNINEDQNPKNFFYVLELEEYNYLKKLNFNVVYQKELDDDGSLSIYSALKGYSYINIECEEDDTVNQPKMLDVITKYLLKKNKLDVTSNN